MRLIGVTLIPVLLVMMPALAAELPSRKPGLWQVKTSIGSSNAAAQVFQQCIDATTDQMMQASAGPFAPAVCPERDVQRSENSITIDSTWAVGGKAATAHSGRASRPAYVDPALAIDARPRVRSSTTPPAQQAVT